MFSSIGELREDIYSWQQVEVHKGLRYECKLAEDICEELAHDFCVMFHVSFFSSSFYKNKRKIKKTVLNGFITVYPRGVFNWVRNGCVADIGRKMRRSSAAVRRGNRADGFSEWWTVLHGLSATDHVWYARVKWETRGVIF